MSKIKKNNVLRSGEANRALGATFRGALLAGSCLSLLVLAPQVARAVNLYSGTYAGQDLEINLDTTAEYSNMLRVSRPSSALKNSLTASYGDLSFAHGLVDNTFSLSPIFDVKWGSWGAHVSGEAYVDTPYLSHTQYDSGITPAAVVNRNNDVSKGTRNIEGENAILLDAFVDKGFNFGANDDQTATVRVGRQTVYWGQSLIFTGNGVAAGQGPVDVNKQLSQPGALAQQLFLPVGQIVASYQPNSVVTFQGYYQFEYAPDTFQGSGAFLNANDMLDKGAAYLVLAQDPYYGIVPGYPAYFAAQRTKDNRPTHNGQFGVSTQFTVGDYDLGLYALRFDSKQPEIYLGNFHGPLPGTYNIVYARDIAIYGASASTDIGAANVAGEISGRTNMPLVTGAGADVFGTGNANSNPLYPVGDTFHAQASTIYLAPGVPLDPGGFSVDGEVELNHVLQVTKNKALLTPGRDATAASFAVFFTPTYYSVLPNLEIDIPLTLIYNAIGRSQIDASMNHGTGQYSFGVKAIYRTNWTATVQYQGFLGAANPSLAGDASIADRGFVNFNIQHTF